MSRRQAEEGGFTLIELLVSIMIISILAAIATQLWFVQRRKGWVAQVHATIRHMAGAQNHVIYNTEDGSYTLSVAELEDIGFNYSDDVIPEVVAADRETFCIQMTSAHDDSIVWHYNSVVGYPEEGPGDEDACGVGASSGSLASADTGGSEVNDGTRGSSGSSDDDDDAGSNGGGVDVPPGMTGGSSIGDEFSNGGNSGGSNGGSEGGSNGGSGGNDPAPTTSDPTWDDVVSNPTGGGGGAGGCRGDRNDPDADNNGGRDEVGGVGGNDPDRDCNNGSGNDDDAEDDNNAGGANK